MKRHANVGRVHARALATAIVFAGIAGCGGGSGNDAAMNEEPSAVAGQSSTASDSKLVQVNATDPSQKLTDFSLPLFGDAGWLQLAGGAPAPVTNWNADPPGAYVASVRAAIANPVAGTSNTAHLELESRYPQLLRSLRAQGTGASTLGNADVDAYASNSFDIIRYPEESVDDTSQHTYHKYGALTYLGPVDSARGITKSWVTKNVLVDRYGYPAMMLMPTPTNLQSASVAYAVSPVLASNPANLANSSLYVTRIGVIEQVSVPDGVVNITTTDHTVYPGTTRRTVIEFEGGLYIYTTGSGVNRYYNSGQGYIPGNLLLTELRNTYQSGYAYGNDTFGPPAFQALDQQAVTYLNGVRAAKS